MRFTKRSNRTGPVLFTALAFVVAVLTAAYFVRDPATRTAVTANEGGATRTGEALRYTGSIVIPDPDTKLCRHLLFDNKTAQIREVGASDCAEAGPDANSTEGRIGAIRRSFARQPGG